MSKPCENSPAYRCQEHGFYTGFYTFILLEFNFTFNDLLMFTFSSSSRSKESQWSVLETHLIGRRPNRRFESHW